MHVLNRKVLDQAVKHHGDLKSPLARWFTIVTQARWRNLTELRKTFRDTDCVEGVTIFNIKGNNYRLHAEVNFQAQAVFLRKLETHAEYSKRTGGKT